jgi:hypothetical protein
MEMGNQEWNSGITKEMGNQTFKESSQVLSSSLKKALSNSLHESPSNSAYKYKEESFK